MVAMTQRPTYTATCVRSDGWWAVEVPDVPGALTQARRLDQVEAMVRDAIATLLQVAEDSFDVVIQARLPRDLDRAVRRAQQARGDAEKAQATAGDATSTAAARLRDADLAMRDVGWLLGISHQRVAQLADR